LNPSLEPFPSRSCAVCCDVAAAAAVRVGVESLPELRKQPGPVHAQPLPASFLKHADEQTVVGLAAVYKAVHASGLQSTCFDDWGVVAAPRFFGRPAMAAALVRFQAEGAWGVSPHLIPHRSLHSMSGTVSQALKIHGPNFGVGGGPGAAAEALLAAAAMLEGQKLPGVWVVLSCLDPEQAPDETGRLAPGIRCVGLALALTPIRPSRSHIRLRVVCGASAPDGPRRASAPEGVSSGFDLLRLESLLALLRGEGGGDTRVVQLLDAGTRIELSLTARGSGRVARDWCLVDPRSPIHDPRLTMGGERVR
jgi:hypothetical protein